MVMFGDFYKWHEIINHMLPTMWKSVFFPVIHSILNRLNFMTQLRMQMNVWTIQSIFNRCLMTQSIINSFFLICKIMYTGICPAQVLFKVFTLLHTLLCMGGSIHVQRFMNRWYVYTLGLWETTACKYAISIARRRNDT